MSIMMKRVTDSDVNDNFIDTNCYYSNDYDNDNNGDNGDAQKTHTTHVYEGILDLIFRSELTSDIS